MPVMTLSSADAAKEARGLWTYQIYPLTPEQAEAMGLPFVLVWEAGRIYGRHEFGGGRYEVDLTEKFAPTPPAR